MKPNINVGTLDDIKFPEILYKYRDWDNTNNRRSILNREVYLSSPDQFEDRFDCKIPIRYDLMTKEQAYKFYERLHGLSGIQLNRSETRKKIKNLVKAKEYTSKKLNAEYEEKYFREFLERIGILCLTAENKLEEMWVKYANNHSGFCIGYNSRILFESLGGGGKVEYVDTLPIIMPDPIMDRDTQRYKQVYHKLKEWQFEKEYRTEKFWFNSASRSDRQIEIPKEAFHSIILGKNITDLNRHAIIDALIANIGDHVQIIDYNSII
ncbi:DUF2971 domain-containing protein [Elizabethkingia anophelis]|uniref:DUF2971 domain-containing protein n=1 Tax=Elizabethkingia anophelis TaxID=1117645 RepID=UPI00099AA0AB|nr:DUF2971 domain-containing protein [Elizabethkingia anophelis]MCT4234970.1 DUF2971 domain-containing protein [Elizabethkingia anophelis]OPC30734.1 hypothetical protein BAX98_09000 [Elizabethkingia anophelis]